MPWSQAVCVVLPGLAGNLGLTGARALPPPRMVTNCDDHSPLPLPLLMRRCEALVEQDVAHLVPAFEALVVLVGTAGNARAAWER